MRKWCQAKPERVPPTAKKAGEVARARLLSIASLKGRRCFVRLHMWRSVKDLRAARPNEQGEFYGLCEPYNRWVSRRIADVHFGLDHINLDVVAHEMTHALVHRINVLGPDPLAIILQTEEGKNLFGRAPKYFGGRADEEIAYEMGRWVHFTYSWAYDTWRRYERRRRRSHG